jgi:predicted kinase
LPACGKSTRAQEIILASGNTVRLNKDLARTMLHFDRWSGRLEDLTHQAVAAMARALLPTTNVIIDDTNLNPRVMTGWKALAVEAGAKAEVIDLTTVPVDECVARDLARGQRGGRSVGAMVIRNMALRYGLVTFQTGQVVLCDLDGTIADIRHRLPLVRVPEGQPKDWKGFFAAIPADTVREDVRALLEAHRAAGRTIIFVSARPDTYKTETLDWLARHDLAHYTLLMRRGGDKRSDEIVKQEMLDQHFPDRAVIHEVIDDRPRVLRMWSAAGLSVHDVGCGVEF